MSGRGVRISLLVAATAMLSVALAVLVLYGAVQGMLPDLPELRERVSGRLLGWGALLVALAGFLGAWTGARIATPLVGLRNALLGRGGAAAAAAGDAALPSSRIAEVARLAHAAELNAREHRERSAGLARDREQLDLLVRSVSEGLLTVDARGRLSFANPAGQQLLALPAAAVGQPLASLVRSVELRAAIGRALAGERVDAAEIGLGERRLLVSARPLHQGAGPHGAVLAIADMTELRRLEGVRRDFVANVSHELKTPLTSIRGYLETVLHDAELPPDMARQFLEVATRNAERLQRIVDELLDLARIESGNWQPDVQELDAAEVVADAWLACEPRALQQRVRFLPPAAPLHVRADPNGLRHVLANLFDNALRHTPANGHIEVRLQRADARVVFEVRDTGSGIPGDALPRIFERFYRVDPARSRAEGGTGLGLAIVKHLVETMGGDVSAESELGKGTTIRFRLPAAA
jgi:signal transduction histidine kinase